MKKEKLKATLQYGGKTAEMGTPEAEKLVEKLVTDVYEGGNMPGVRIEIKRIEGLNIKPKEDRIILSMEAYMSPGDMARLRYLSGQGVPVSAVIESPQATMDLRVEEINIVTGEIIRSREPVAVIDSQD